MDISIYNKQSAIKISEENIRNIVREILYLEDRTCDEIYINFVDKKEISSLHKQFFNDDSPTDCISFPMDNESDEGYNVLGEVFVCPQIAIEYASTHNTDQHEELTLYLIHSTLHLLGYKDIEEKDKKVMREKEQKHLQNLKNKKLARISHEIL